MDRIIGMFCYINSFSAEWMKFELASYVRLVMTIDNHVAKCGHKVRSGDCCS